MLTFFHGLGFAIGVFATVGYMTVFYASIWVVL